MSCPLTSRPRLRLAQTANLNIAQARTVIDQYRALQQKANVTAIPNFVIGSEYIHHEGNIQKTEGNIEKVNRDSLWTGGGPTMTFQFADAIFAPLVARQRAERHAGRVAARHQRNAPASGQCVL